MRPRKEAQGYRRVTKGPGVYISSRSVWRGYYWVRGSPVKWNRADQVLMGMRWDYYRSTGKSTPRYERHEPDLPQAAHQHHAGGQAAHADPDSFERHRRHSKAASVSEAPDYGRHSHGSQISNAHSLPLTENAPASDSPAGVSAGGNQPCFHIHGLSSRTGPGLEMTSDARPSSGDFLLAKAGNVSGAAAYPPVLPLSNDNSSVSTPQAQLDGPIIAAVAAAGQGQQYSVSDVQVPLAWLQAGTGIQAFPDTAYSPTAPSRQARPAVARPEVGAAATLGPLVLSAISSAAALLAGFVIPKQRRSEASAQEAPRGDQAAAFSSQLPSDAGLCSLAYPATGLAYATQASQSVGYFGSAQRKVMQLKNARADAQPPQ